MERFWSKVNKTSDCWEWTASLRGGTGLCYGQFWLDGKHHSAHRLSWEWANGVIPSGLHVLHRCNNPKCVKPEHLYLGTQIDNERDKFIAGDPSRKLTAQDAKNIIKDGRPQREIAEDYGISQNMVSRIINNTRWKNVNDR